MFSENIDSSSYQPESATFTTLYTVQANRQAIKYCSRKQTIKDKSKVFHEAFSMADIRFYAKNKLCIICMIFKNAVVVIKMINKRIWYVHLATIS